MNNPFSHMGKGFDYPFNYVNGNVAKAEYIQSINASLYLILDTKPGELFMSPHIGCRLWELAFQPIDEVFYALATEYITQAIYDQEPRIEAVRIRFIDSEDGDPNKTIIRILYDVVNTDYTGELSYEFKGEAA